MYNIFFRKYRKRVAKKYADIDPQDIFLDSANLPGFAEHRFEGRIEKPIPQFTFLFVKFSVVIIIVLFILKLGNLQLIKGSEFVKISENNRLSHTLIFANRGIIFDRYKKELAINSIKEGNDDFAGRLYSQFRGVTHAVGYLKYPNKDSAGFYYQEEYIGQAGAEKVFNDILKGKNGLKITETNALGEITSESVIQKPIDGKDLILSIDAELSDTLHKSMNRISSERSFSGGAGVIMDVNSGEILAISSFPEYDANLVTEGKDKENITKLFNSEEKPFLDRAVSGLYTPGSIVKPIVALAALHEKIINPNKQILSTGSISIPNPYDKTKPSVFRDWKAHGWVDMRDALAVSSDVYFYAIGGGFEDQRGMGINIIDKYYQMFGLTEKTGINLPNEGTGIIPSPEWKKENFNGESWRLGDTYITSIGQYGTQVTALEAVRWTAAIANEGSLLVPSVLYGGKSEKERIFRKIDLPRDEWRIVKEGMLQGVESGVVTVLKTPEVKVAAKTGTAELGVSKKLVNSWVTGFFPYDKPRYAFAIIMEKGDRDNIVGAGYVMQDVLNWMIINRPEYIN